VTFTAFAGAGAAFFADLRAGAFFAFVAFFAALRAILHSPLQRLSCVKLNETAGNAGLLATLVSVGTTSDAIQFLMERDRASLQMRQKARKTRLFGVSGEFSALAGPESQRKKADLQGFWRSMTD
jgi:hypothetical protein